MVTYAAGQIVRANELNALPHTYYMKTDQSVINSNALVDASGLNFPVDAATWYALDCWFLYDAHPTAGFKCGLRVPTGTTGEANLIVPNSSTAPIAGAPRINYIDFGAFSIIGNSFAGAGDQQFPGGVFIGALLRGWILIGSTSGLIQFQFAQNTAYAGLATKLKKGSWMRLDKME